MFTLWLSKLVEYARKEYGKTLIISDNDKGLLAVLYNDGYTVQGAYEYLYR